MHVGLLGARTLPLKSLGTQVVVMTSDSKFQSALMIHGRPCSSALLLSLLKMSLLKLLSPAPHLRYPEYSTTSPSPGAEHFAAISLPSSKGGRLWQSSSRLPSPRCFLAETATPAEAHLLSSDSSVAMAGPHVVFHHHPALPSKEGLFSNIVLREPVLLRQDNVSLRIEQPVLDRGPTRAVA